MTKETNVWIVCEGLPTYTRLAAARRATLTTCRAGVLRKKKKRKEKGNLLLCFQTMDARRLATPCS